MFIKGEAGFSSLVHIDDIKNGITVFEITKKVSFNIASEASYVYILIGQKLLKMPKIVGFC